MDSRISIGDYGAAAKAYREIKKRIIDLRYGAGEKLSEARLVAELGLGRSPIRTALARLQGEGWIAVSPQSGTYVRGLTKQEIADVLEFRIVLESHVAGLAATRISDAELARLRRAFDQFGPTVADDRMEEYLDLDMALHVAVYNAAGNALITQNLLNLIDKVRWIHRGSTGSLGRIQKALDEAKKVLQALERRDPDAAAKAMRLHITNVLKFRTGKDARKKAPPEQKLRLSRG